MPRGSISLLCVALAGCGAPAARLPLLTPFSPTNGATPVPGNGVGMGIELGSAVRGPELAQSEMRSMSIGVGAGDALSIWYGNPTSQDNVDGYAAHAGVRQLRAKLVFARPFDARGAVAVYGAHAWGERIAHGIPAFPDTTSPLLQSDRAWSWDLAVPAELLIGRRRAEARPSVFLGPRLIYLHYDDRMRPDGTFSTVFPGGVAGLHVSAYQYEFFFEGTLAYVPHRVYGGAAVGGRLGFMPAMGVTVRLGPPYGWRRPRH